MARPVIGVARVQQFSARVLQRHEQNPEGAKLFRRNDALAGA
jgi:hypothetical protein